MNPHAAVVVDKAQLAELVHEVADSRSSRADHARQRFLADFRNHRLPPTILAKVGKQKQDPSQPLLARIEKLIDQILFKSNIAGEQVCREELRKFMVSVQQPHHGLFAETKDCCVFSRRGC